MAGRRLLIIFSLLILTEQFEVREDEWEELRPDIAALHRLRGLPEHMSHETLKNSVNQRDMFIHGARVQRSISRVDIDRNPMSLQDNLQECNKSFPDCVKQMEQDFQNFLEVIDEQKVQDWLLHASDISHSYSRKLLVMTDKEKSTNDRVQQEYSMDPHYSVIVSKECLDNVSCVPDADSYTVVKIFGSVSEDGQTVSGLSGSALAEMMLKPSLEDVPVFSIDGNTTTHFQHNFIRVFVVRGIEAVLETKQDNHQIYQIMNQPDSVSRYEIPQRPVDHTTQYDHQQILIMENDPVVQKAGTFLYEKHPTVSSVYVLDKNQRPKLIHGDSVPLTEDSRLVLVGHGVRDNSGEMRLAGYTAQEVGKVIKKTPRVSDKIKTTSVVACEAGSDKVFVETLLRELHDAGIKTELHLRDAVVQVRHTGEKITQEISTDGLKWRHKDDSKKVVATLDRNGDVIIRNEPGSKGEAIFTNERNLLMPKKTPKTVRTYRDSWPEEPQRFIDQNIFKSKDQNKANRLRAVCDELEALSWGIFHRERTTIGKMNTNHLQDIEQHYVIGERIETDNNIKINWINSEQGLRDVLSQCFEIRSGADVRNVIRHYAKTGENVPTYLMVNDWIYVIDPKSLYVFPVGKRLDINQIGNKERIKEVQKSIVEQIGQERYPQIRNHISSEQYAEYARGILIGEPLTYLSAWYTTYFTASVISESVRNFRTFPLTLMALDMVQSGDNNYMEKGQAFLLEGHPMATGGSWTDPNMRGFLGTVTVPEQSKAEDKVPGPSGSSRTDSGATTTSGDEIKERLGNLKEVLNKEVPLYRSWKALKKQQQIEAPLLTLFEEYNFIGTPQSIINDYNTFKTQLSEPSASGTLGGYNDGHVTPQDLKSSTELENSFKHESYFSRVQALSSEQIHNQMKAKYGENLAGMHLQEGSARMENGQFICNLVSEGAEPEEFRVKMSPESQHYNEKLLKGIETAVHDLESHGPVPSHQVNKYVEHIGTAVGTLGLMLGMKGAVRAFEQGDVKDGVMGALQTAHGVTAMTASVIARQTLSSEARIARATATFMKSPVMRGTMKVIPVVGIGFGIYNLEQDLERGDTLGYIDAVFDAGMIGLDVVEIAQPELAPFIIPVNLALSTVRMVFDDVYMGVENELKSLPKDAGVLDKLRAVTVGLGKGILHFGIHVASFFYDWHYDEIEEGHRLVAQISDYHKYYETIKEQDGTSAIDFHSGDSSWNGGGIHFRLADQGQSELCMDYFVSSDESSKKNCWKIDAQGSKDIILGLGESHQLEHKTLQKKVLLFIPAGSVTVVSGYKAVSNSRYGIYTGNKDANRFFAIQTAEDQQMTEVMLSYYYSLYGEPGDDIFFLGPQISYVQGSGGKDTYIIPKNGGKTTINNYDPSKALDTLHFSVDYSHISVSKSGDDVVLRYEGSHTVTIEGWFLGELYRHMNMISGDGVLFEISSTVISSVRLVARGINKMSEEHGARVDSSQPLLRTVTTIFGSRYDDTLIGNEEKNVIDGGGGRDHLIGAEGEDMYIVKDRQQSSVLIENHSRDMKTDLAIIEANLHTFKVSVESDNVVLNAFHDNTAIHVTLMRWFRSPEDRHLLVVTKDLITFTISDNKADCLHGDPFTKCIKSLSIDYSKSPSRLVVDLQEDEALNSVTEVRGSDFNDVIRGNKEPNVIVPGRGNDYIQGRGGEDWYVITPGQGTIKTINNESPDLILDILFLKEHSRHITSTCDGRSIIIWVNGTKEVILQNWFDSKNYQHLHIRTSDGITAGFISNSTSDSKSLFLPITVDYRNQKPKPLDSFQTHSVNAEDELFLCGLGGCFTYSSKNSTDRLFCSLQGKMMNVADVGSVKELYGSSGFDIIVGNSNENLLDPHTGGALMFGGEGKDTYVIKHGYGNNLLIDNFAEDLNIDTVLVDMDFLSGSQVTLQSSAPDLNVTIETKEDLLVISLLDYNNGYQHQHLEFQSSDGVNFKLKSLNSTGDVPLFDIEAFKVTLKQSQVDCHLDLNSQRNLSKVHTVQGCPSLSNGIVGNDQDNALIGGWKDDTLEGGEGDDTLMGGNGDDILIGDLGDDTLYGEDGNDTMMGNSGQDVFIPGPGADLVDGGPGRDTVLYRGDHDTGKGVYVNLITGQGRYADAEGDVLKDVETVIGTIYSDILVAGYESSLLKGSDGNDILVSTGGDYLVGGEGNDIYVLAFHDSSVTINNCAKDNAMDVLYLSSRTIPTYDCQLLSDRLLLTFYGLNQTAVKLVLEGWTSDHHECGHLKVVFRNMELSVGQVVVGCQEKRSN